MLLEDVEKVKSYANNTYEKKKTIKTNFIEKDEEETKVTPAELSTSDPLYKRMMLRARALYPYAQSDAHALARWFQDKEKEDKADTEFLKLELDDMQSEIDAIKKEINEIKRTIGEA